MFYILDSLSKDANVVLEKTSTTISKSVEYFTTQVQDVTTNALQSADQVIKEMPNSLIK
jgi:hypothetical protein